MLMRVLTAAGIAALLVAGVVATLVVVFDLQIEFTGSGMRPIVSFDDPDAHYAALEANRAAAADRAAAIDRTATAEETATTPDGAAAERTATTPDKAAAEGTATAPDGAAADRTTPAADLDAGRPPAEGSGAASSPDMPRAAGADAEASAGTNAATDAEASAGTRDAAAPAEAPVAAGAAGDGAGAGAAPPDPPRRAVWTDFRGPHRDGQYTETAIRTDWPEAGLDPLWRQPVGGGYASFVVADGLAFTIEQRRDHEVVAAYDVDTGVERWTHAWPAHFREVLGGPGPRATPTWHDGRLYALGATGRFVCLDARTGEAIWTRDILADGGADNLHWAMSGAPLVVDDLVVVQPGGPDGWSVAAYDHRTGDVVWHVLDDEQGYTSPMLATLGGVRQIVVVTAARAAGLQPGDGTLLWDFPWAVSTVPNISQPVAVGDRQLFLSASYGKGAALIELTPRRGGFTAAAVWETSRMKNKFSSSVLIDGYLYGLDNAILACLDAATGELMWKGGRYGYGQLLAAGNHLVVLTERGDVVLVRATPDGLEELAQFHAIDGKTWNVPALADGRLLVRNARQMAAFDLSP